MSAGRKNYVLFGIGNPILDVVFKGSKKLLKRFNLEENSAVVAGPEQEGLFSYLAMPGRPEMFYTPGGTVLNVMRGAQKFLPQCSTVFVGCVGCDKASQFLRVACERDGVRVEFHVDRERCTGKSAVIITKANRTLCADLASAELYSIKHLCDPKIWYYVEQCRIFYTDAFFLKCGMESIETLLTHIRMMDKELTFNLSASFVMETSFNEVRTVLPHASVVFGNADEARAFAKAIGWSNTMEIAEIARSIGKIPGPGAASSGSRIVAITDGPNPTSVYDPASDTILEASVIKVKEERVVDTTGAGDAFAAGFLAQYCKNRDIETCIWAGHYLAAIVIQNIGAVYGINLPSTCPRKFLS